MSHPILDPSLDLPADIPAVAAIDPPAAGLVRSSRADGHPLTMAGARAVIRATGLGGVESLTGDGAPVVGAIRLAAPPAANVLVTPRTLVRERVGAGGGLRETVVVPERLPGAVVQWTGTAPEGGWVLEVDLPVEAARLRLEGPTLRWAGADDDGGGILRVVGPYGGGGWEALVRDGRPSARIVVEPTGDEPATLLATAASAGGRLPSLAALGAVAAHRRRDDLEPDDAPGISLATGIGDLDQGVAWARASLRARVDESGAEPRLRWGDPAAAVRGALAAAEIDAARAALAVSRPGLDDAEARALFVAWTAHPRPLLEARARLDPVLAEAPATTRARVADAAEAAGDESWAAELRRPVARDGGRRLPTLAGAPTPSTPPPGAGLEPGDGPPGPAELRLALDRTLSGDPAWGWSVLRRALEELRARGPGADPDGASVALDLLVRGVLGVEPDAAYGRVRLAPWFPEHWTAFRIDGLMLADARVGLEMEREGRLHRFRLRQTAGGAPVTWIFEPRLPGVALAAARVDGEEARLDFETEGGRIRPRIQLPAERERVVELEVSPP